SRSYKGHKRMFLMTGFPLKRSYILSAIAKGQPLDMAFPCPGSSQAQHFKILVIHVQTGREHFFYIKRILPFILNEHRTSQCIGTLKHRIYKRNLHTKQTVPAENLQSTAL